jgi:hypothetical protein
MRVSISVLLSLYAATSVSAQNATNETSVEPETDTESNTTTTTTTSTLAPVLPPADGFNATGGPPYDQCDVSDYYARLLATSSNPLDWVMEELALHIEATHRNTELPNIATVRGDGTLLRMVVCLYLPK